MKKFFMKWILPQLFYVPTWFIFLNGRDVTLGLLGMYTLMIALLSIGDAIIQFANDEL
ncbi:hypothetical protein [Bacillus mycoides]|uniref:hypothetical protein n=1 Tax=Bacillus mycoides TaxID=1405 RepID=UPI000A27DBCC|nr:hypothetical protein [Bacillus mycoides]OSY02626.1 hypothetical protein BTJ44_05683 [Bacillus mycoides]